MMQGAFEHRSGRVVSLARLALAAVFLIAIWADPSQPSRYPDAAFAVLGGYIAVSAIYLAATWSNWWLEHRLAIVAHAFDIALFGAMVYLTEGYTSPFFTFFVFLILSATIRWSWKVTAGTALVVTFVFLLAGLAAAHWTEVEPNLARTAVRATYLVILSLLLIWFSLNQRGGLLQQHAGGEPAAPDPSAAPPVREGLQQAMARTGARRAALAWWDEDEPWVHVAMLAGGRFSEQRFAPDFFGELVDPRLAGRAFLFDERKGHVLAERGAGTERLTRIAAPLDAGLRAHIGCTSGLAVPVATVTHGAVFVLCEIPGLCADDLQLGKRIGETFARMLRQSAIVGMFEAAAADRTRLAIARDLHDTIVQLLAGTALRLQGIRRGIAAGRAVDDELKGLQDALAAEQQGLRMLIGEIRSDPSSAATQALADGLRRTAEQAARQWGIAAELQGCPADIRVGTRLGHEIGQLVREAIANAARHGGAEAVVVTADRSRNRLALSVRDDGRGFAAPRRAPRSLEERVHALGGTLKIDSTPAGSTVTMRLPWEWT